MPNRTGRPRAQPTAINTGYRARQRAAARPAVQFTPPTQSMQRAIMNARIGGYLGIERKFLDTSVSNGAIVSATTMAGAEMDPSGVNTISAPAQGDGQSNRDGRQITVDSAYVNGVVNFEGQSDQADLPEGLTVALWLVMDMQTNGAQLNSENVFTNPSGNANCNVAAFRDLQYIRRFKVLDKQVIEFPPIPGGTDGTDTNSTAGCHKTFKLSYQKPFLVNFTGTSGNVSTVSDTSLHVIAIANRSSAATVSYNSRIRFRG